MSGAEFNYAPLPGKGRALISSFASGEFQRLYSAEDHLLVVRTNYGEETYKKFFYNDIQAITLKSNSDRIIVGTFHGLIIGFVMFLALLVAQSFGTDAAPVFVVMLIVSVLPIYLFVKNLVLGPTCTVTLHTAVQQEELTALRRQNAALKSIAIIDENIRLSQGELDFDELRRKNAAGEEIRASGHLPQPVQQREITDINVTPHAIAFAGMLYIGVSIFVDFLIMEDVKNLLDMIVMVVSLVFFLVAAYRQANSTVSPRLKLFTWLGIANYALMYFSAIVVTIFLAMQADFGTTPGLHNPMGEPALNWPISHQITYGLQGLFALTIAVGGFMLIARYHNRDPEWDPVEPEPTEADRNEFTE